MTVIPQEQIEDAHKLQADAEIFLYELTPIGGGTVYFKSDNPIEWQGNLYEGLPLSFTGDTRSSEGGSSRPTLTIGDENINLIALKPLLFDGHVDGATVLRRRILLETLLADQLGTEDEYFKARQVADYGRTSITLELARQADSLDFAFPFHQYYSPDFPTVKM